MPDICIFRRVEKKYLITEERRRELMDRIGERLCRDEYGQSTVCSLYLDTPDFRLIRNSIDATTYKEKLRLRSYGTPGSDSRVFLELKKKYRGVVYKRRLAVTYRQAEVYLRSGIKPFDSQSWTTPCASTATPGRRWFCAMSAGPLPSPRFPTCA